MTTVLGVDLGTHKIAISVWKDARLESVWAYDAPGGHRGEQLAECSGYLYEWAADSLEDQESDVWVFIEEPLVGNNIKYSMQISQLYGVCLAELSHLESLSGVYAAPVGTWKKEVCGNGRADKEMIRKTLTELDAAYAVLCDQDQDKYDAACIGLYGVLLSARAKGLALS